MKYETIPEACEALANLRSDRFKYYGHFKFLWIDGVRRFMTEHLSIDDMYSILSEIGYTMQPVSFGYGDITGNQYYAWFQKYKTLGSTVKDENGENLLFDYPEHTHKPAFLAAINHFLEQSNG